MDNVQADYMWQQIKELKDRLDSLSKRDAPDWANPLSLGSTLGVTGDITSNANIAGKNHYTQSVSSLADEGVGAYTPGEPYGVAILNLRISTYQDFWGIANYRVSTTTFCVKMVGGAVFNVATVSGVPVYTGYTDGYVTMVASDNGNLYVVNRRGIAITFGLTFLGT